MPNQVCQICQRCAPPFSAIYQKPEGGGGAKINPHAVRVLRSASDLTVDNCTSNSHSSVDDGTVLPNLTAPVTSFGTNLGGNAYLSTPAAVRGISYFVSGRESESESQSESVQRRESESESEQNHHDSETLHINTLIRLRLRCD